MNIYYTNSIILLKLLSVVHIVGNLSKNMEGEFREQIQNTTVTFS